MDEPKPAERIEIELTPVDDTRGWSRRGQAAVPPAPPDPAPAPPPDAAFAAPVPLSGGALSTERRRLGVTAVAVAALALLVGLRLGSRSTVAERPVAAAAPPRQEGLDPAGFWQLMRKTRADGDDDTARQSGLLENRVKRLPQPAIEDFRQIRHRLDQRLYTWDVWGAAYVIEDGCSDDCFRDFRAYLISLGPEVYERALRDPDSLAGRVKDAEQGDWENADDPLSDSDLSGPPSGTPWDDDHVERLIRRYPRLAAEFR